MIRFNKQGRLVTQDGGGWRDEMQKAMETPEGKARLNAYLKGMAQAELAQVEDGLKVLQTRAEHLKAKIAEYDHVESQ